MGWKHFCLAGLLTLVAAASGCGSGGSSSAEELSKTEVIRKADAVCAKIAERYSANLAKLTKEAKQPPSSTKDEAQLVVDAVAPVLEDGAEELAVISRANDKEELVALVGALEGIASELQSDPLRATSGSPFAKFNKLAKARDLNECSGF